MDNFVEWAISNAQTVQNGDPIEYEGKTYVSTTKVFRGTLNAGRVRALKNKVGEFPVNDELRQVTCKWGGNYRKDAKKVMVVETVFTEVAH